MIETIPLTDEEFTIGLRSAGGWQLVSVHRNVNNTVQYYWTREQSSGWDRMIMRQQEEQRFLAERVALTNAENK